VKAADCALMPPIVCDYPRGYHRVLRIARTLAVLKGGGPVARIHIVEAVAYRRIASGKNLVTAKF
jgi:predicted ATPase with chaperone activity